MSKQILLGIALLLIGCEGAKHSKDDATLEQHRIESNQQIQENGQSTDSILDQETETFADESGELITKAQIFEKDSSFHLTANIKADHRIFGYERPDTASQKLLLLSVFTNDVKNNPYNLKFGAYYDTSGMDSLTLKYQETVGDFIKVSATETNGETSILFFEKEWVEFNK